MYTYTQTKKNPNVINGILSGTELKALPIHCPHLFSQKFYSESPPLPFTNEDGKIKEITKLPWVIQSVSTADCLLSHVL